MQRRWVWRVFCGSRDVVCKGHIDMYCVCRVRGVHFKVHIVKLLRGKLHCLRLLRWEDTYSDTRDKLHTPLISIESVEVKPQFFRSCRMACQADVTVTAGCS